jgi:transcriptional regulator with XRE-family HTH domain
MSHVPNLRSVRLKRHLTQDALAAAADVSRAAIQTWESGTRAPSMRSLNRVAAALGVTIPELTGEAATPTHDDARDGLRRGADYPGIIELLADQPLCASLRITEADRDLLLRGIIVGRGPATAQEAMELLQALRHMTA